MNRVFLQKTFFALSFLLFFGPASKVMAQEKPNILWLVCEDMSPYLSSYGNKSAKTPNLDSLAKNGIRYTRAHSNSVQCSPSRSTLISGKYAVSLATDIHRERRPVPDEFYYPIYLRQNGYYCTNNNKQDYNTKKTPENVWNENGNKASYTKRADRSQPFFAVFNCGITHMGRVATRTVAGRSPRTVNPKSVSVPAYIPDLPEVRDDIAWNMDAVMLMDEWIGQQLAILRKSGEAENTIVVFNSDHGGTVPRGKAYVYESGTHIPLIVYFPEKWKHLAGTKIPSLSDRLVSFIDFAPTFYNLTGTRKPDFMTDGKPFLGPGSNNPENIKKYVFTFRANQGLNFAPSRAISDGEYKLIWNFQTGYPNGTRQDYQWQMPAQQAWDIANREGKLKNPIYKKFWEPVDPFELYNVKKDSMEVNNLVNDKAHSAVFSTLKKALYDQLVAAKDLGLTPRELRLDMQKEGGAMYNIASKPGYDVKAQIDAAATASYRKLENLKTLLGYLSAKDPVIQYWGASGINALAKTGLIKIMDAAANRYFTSAAALPEAQCLLAEARIYLNNKDAAALDFLGKKVQEGFGPALMSLLNMGKLATPVNPILTAALANKKQPDRFYIRAVLVNTGGLPYSELYPAGEKVSD